MDLTYSWRLGQRNEESWGWMDFPKAYECNYFVQTVSTAHRFSLTHLHPWKADIVFRNFSGFAYMEGNRNNQTWILNFTTLNMCWLDVEYGKIAKKFSNCSCFGLVYYCLNKSSHVTCSVQKLAFCWLIWLPARYHPKQNSAISFAEINNTLQGL